MSKDTKTRVQKADSDPAPKDMLKVVWAITGAGDLIEKVFAVMHELTRQKHLELTAVLSKAAVTVLKWYKLWDDLPQIADKILVEKDANTPFIAGPLQAGQFDFLLVAPATANSVSKIVNGIADTIITNAVAQTNKTDTAIYILPVDQKKGTVITLLPNGQRLKISMRDIDIENSNKLKEMQGIIVLENAEAIKDIPRIYAKV